MTKPIQTAIEHNTELLQKASVRGHTKQVKRLIPVSNPEKGANFALLAAAGHNEIVQLLIPVSNPKIGFSEALQEASKNGHIECVKLLMPVSDPTHHCSHALQVAVLNGHTGCVELLIPVSDYNCVLSYLKQRNCSNTDLLQQCIEEYETLQQKARLTHEIYTIQSTKNNIQKRKM